MPITSQNAVLNQYVPPFCVDRPVAGETFIYDPNKKTWANKLLTAQDLGGVAPDGLIWQGGIFGPGDVVTISEDLTTFVSTPRSEFGGEGSVTRLNHLSDVRIVDPIDRQSFVFDTALSQWINRFVSYNDLIDPPADGFPSAPHVHPKSEISDFDEADYATADQGGKADSAIQPGNNVSVLVNDAGYVTLEETFSGDYGDLNNVPTEFVPSYHKHVEDDIGDLDKYTKAEVDNLIFSGDYGDLNNVPTEFVPVLHGHTKSQISDFNEADYATANQGGKADSAIQPGNNVSVLVNDAGYLTNGLQSGDNISELINDAGYIIDITAESIGDLQDVNITGAFNGAILTWNGSNNSFVLDEKTFIKGTDTPADYAGHSGKLLSVNVAEDAVEFTDVIDGGQY